MVDAIGTDSRNECAVVYGFLVGKVRGALYDADGARRTIRPEHEAGWWRAVAWLSTLTRADSPVDYQAVSAAARALLELSVDAVLLHGDPDAPARLADWEDSARLHHAEAIAAYYEDGPPSPSSFMLQAIEFAKREGPRILRRRVERGWIDRKTGKPRHPDRWTKHDLAFDAKEADRLAPELKLREVYATEYRGLCLRVHAAGAAGQRNLDEQGLADLVDLSLGLCAVLATRYAGFLIKCASLWDTPLDGATWAQHFDDIAQRRAEAFVRRASPG